MKPYYESGGITIYHGDCREVLPTVSASCAITDPPYNVGIKYGKGTDDRRADYREWCADWFGATLRVTGGNALVSCGVANIGMWWTIAAPRWVMAWHKPAAMGRCTLGFNNWEPVLVYGKTIGMLVDVFKASIVPDSSVEGHPCPKPLEWAAKQVGMVSVPGGTVLDPFMGSGTTLRAAKDLGRKAIGIEMEERYCEMAARRLDQEVLSL